MPKRPAMPSTGRKVQRRVEETTCVISDVKPATKLAKKGVFKPPDKSECFEVLTENQLVASSEIVVNGFVAASHLAFNHHYPLVFSPDDVWFQLESSLSLHINQNPEKYRGLLVKHKDGKKQIKIRADWLQRGKPSYQWHSVFGDFSTQIRDGMGQELHELLMADFTTTTPAFKVCSEIALMDVTKSFYDYKTTTRCGIPAITLLGTVDDWNLMREKIRKLGSLFDLKWWVEELDVLLKEFVCVKKGQVNKRFWRDWYRYEETSGGAEVTGHINLLFPYLQSDPAKVERNQFIGMPKEQREALFQQGPSPGHFPRTQASMSHKWDYLGVLLDMKLWAGFVNPNQDRKTLAVRPTLAWGLQYK
eukprot:m.66023 g.66023  ORF g.66023 m.66023 type:complete len:362 (+) comp19680_c0_seq3:66-1151(+)